VHATSIVGYTYAADEYCCDCIAAMFDRATGGDGNVSGFLAEEILADAANRLSVDRMDESSFDSGDFPKVIFASMVESDDEYCGECHCSLID
jgi:hypothetical protein